jgi:exonuclease III
MGSVSLKVLSLNVRRFERQDKILNIKHFCELSSADVICFQEIHITTALKIFSSQYQVYVNFYNNQDIGIVTVVKKGFKIIDFAMCNEGRIIGIKFSNTQIWNVYAASGSGNKKVRESFFRESLPNLMSIWKDQSQNVIQLGDHNCAQRYADSENIAWQKHHVQSGLNAQMELFGLRDELLRLKGNGVQGIYSRVTNVSKTRIDFIMSNTDLCTEFQYIDTDFLNLDHKAAFANYCIDLEKDYRERVPKTDFFWLGNL